MSVMPLEQVGVTIVERRQHVVKLTDIISTS